MCMSIVSLVSNSLKLTARSLSMLPSLKKTIRLEEIGMFLCECQQRV